MINKSVIFLCILLASCAPKSSIPLAQVKAYYKGFENENFEQVQKTLSDSLTIKEGDHVMKFSRASYHEHLRWDSVFKPTYHSVNLTKEGDQIIAQISKSSLKFEFLENNPLQFQEKFYFKEGKIYKIENVGFSNVDWELWETKKNNLTSFIKTQHPELDGFVHDLTMQGGINYLTAIKKFNQRTIAQD